MTGVEEPFHGLTVGSIGDLLQEAGLAYAGGPDDFGVSAGGVRMVRVSNAVKPCGQVFISMTTRSPVGARASRSTAPEGSVVSRPTIRSDRQDPVPQRVAGQGCP